MKSHQLLTKILFISLVIFPLTSMGRGPAVEPVSGISIDDFKEVPPSQAKGYRFTKGQPKQLVPQKTKSTGMEPSKKLQTNIETRSEKQVYGPDSSWPGAVFLFLLLLMPFGLWMSIMKSLDDKEVVQPDNTIPFPVKKAGPTGHDDGDDDGGDLNVPKAS